MPEGPQKRMRASDRKAQIVDVAIRLFGEKGFSGTTTKAIATSAGVSEATIFRHFPSKESLYAEAFRQTVSGGAEEFVGLLQEYLDRQDDEGLLRAVFDAVIFGYGRDRDLHRMLQFAFLEQAPAENARLAEDLFKFPLFGFLASYIEARQADGRNVDRVR